tara:strand:- start:9474 stop:10874 length:1401 start_codon:yes stop_codon:yes gene_type:complete
LILKNFLFLNIRSEKNIIRIFRNELEHSKLVFNGSSGLLAVSGGVDSVVMAHLFLSFKKKFKLNLAIVHLNHCSRNGDSDQDESFVRQLADSIDVPFFSERWESHQKSNFEENARKKRYAFFESKRSEMNYDWISTAHQANDQSETILMRLINGSSYRGLLGISKEKGKLFRPLLGFSKQELINYSKVNGLRFRYDNTNDDNYYDRNRIRNTIIPKIEIINPNFNETVVRTIRNFNEINCLIEEQVRSVYSKLVSISEEGYFKINCKGLKNIPLLIQKELIRTIANCDEEIWRGYIWDELHNFLLYSSTGNILKISNKIRILKDRDYFLIREISTAENSSHIFPKNSFPPFQIDFSRFSFSMAFAKQEIHFSNDPTIEFINYNRLKGSLLLRKWKEGDRMIPLGMKNQKKISDILIDEKINRFNKEDQYVLTSNDEIVWLCGLRLDDRFKVSDSTSSVVKINWFKK